MQEDQKNITVLFFGLGSIGKTHARILKNNYNHELIAYRTKKGQEQNDLKIKEIYNIDDAFDEKPDIAFITNPTNLHIQTALECAKRNIALFIEKPITLRGKEARHLKHLALENQVKVMVDFTFTFSAAVAQMRRLIEKGEIGEISAIYMAMCNTRPAAREDVYFELGSHMLSLLSLFFPLEKFDFDHFEINYDQQRTVEGIISFFPPNKISFGTIYLNYLHPNKERTIVVIGENKAKITYEAQIQPHLVLNKGRKVKRFDQFSEGQNLKFAVAAFYDLIQGRGTKSNIDLGIQVTEILEKIRDNR